MVVDYHLTFVGIVDTYPLLEESHSAHMPAVAAMMLVGRFEEVEVGEVRRAAEPKQVAMPPPRWRLSRLRAEYAESREPS